VYSSSISISWSEQVFKYKAQSFNRGYLYLNGSENQVLTSINNELKVQKIDGKNGKANQLFNVTPGTNAGTYSFQDYEGKSIIINSTDKTAKLIKLSKPGPSQNLKLNQLFDTTNKTKCTAADNCIFKDKQLFTLSTKGTNNSLSTIDYTTKKSDPKLIANAALIGAPSNETDTQQQFEWREYGKDRGYTVLKGTNIALITAKDPKSNKQAIMFRELKADQEIQIFNVIRGTDTNTIQIFDKDLQAISLSGTSVITTSLVKDITTQTFTIGEIVNTTLPCPATPTPQGCLIPKDKVFSLTTADNNAIKIDKGTTPTTAKYNPNDPLQAIKWSELSFNKGNLTILGTNNALASVGGKIVIQTLNKTSKEQMFTVIKGSTPGALIFIDFNGMAINIDPAGLNLIPINRTSTLQNLILKVRKCSDAVLPDKCNITNDQLFSLSDKDNLAIHIPDMKDSAVSAYIRNEIYPEQMLKWEEDGFNLGHLKANASINSKPVKSLASVGDKIITQDYDKTKKEQIFEVTKVGNNYVFKDYQGKVIQISNGRIINSNYNANESKQLFNINAVKITNLCVKNANTDVNKCLMPDNRLITLANKNDLLIDYNHSKDEAIKTKTNEINLLNSTRSKNSNNQSLIWDEDGFNRGFIKIPNTDFVLESIDGIIKPKKINGSINQLFNVKKGSTTNSFKIYDYLGNPMHIKLGSVIYAIGSGGGSLFDPASQDIYINELSLDWKIWVPSNGASTEFRAGGKKDVDYSKGGYVYLKFLNGLDRAKYANKNIDNKEVYIISHGYNDSALFNIDKNGAIINGETVPDGNLKENRMTTLAKTFQYYNPNAIVLILDWSNLAAGAALPSPSLNQAASYINPIAKQLKLKLNDWGIKDSKKQINVVGHSLGTYMANEIGREFNGINNIVALDPASDVQSKVKKCTPNSLDYREIALKLISCAINLNEYEGMTTGNNLKVDKFKQYSEYSIAFTGRRSIAGNEYLASTADESYWMSYDDGGLPVGDLHGFVITSAIGISNKNKLFLNSKETLTAKDYNENGITGRIKRDYQEDFNGVGTYQETCQLADGNFALLKNLYSWDKILTNWVWNNIQTYWILLKSIGNINCAKAETKSLVKKTYIDNNWKELGWGGHNGVLVSKKPSDVAKDAKITSIDTNVQGGFVKIKNPINGQYEKKELYLK
jgi:Lipase